MWKLVWLLITITSIQAANASGTITIQLVEYNHPDGKDVGGVCCENFSKDDCKAECDPYFVLCLKSHTTGKCKSSKTTDRTTDVGHIQFGSSIGTTQNNIVINVSGSMSDLELSIDVLDSDSDGIFDQKDDLIDTLAQRMQLIPTLSSQTPAVFTDLELQGRRTSISLKYRAQCDQYYYGNECDVICQPQPEQYSCDIQGNKICFASYQCELRSPTITTATPTSLTPISTVENTTFTKQILTSGNVVSVSMYDSITATRGMTMAPMLGSITFGLSSIVTRTIIKPTTSSVSLQCKAVVDNSSFTDMVRIENLPSDQLSIFQELLLQQLQNLTGTLANRISISVINKTSKNQHGQIDITFSVTSNDRAFNGSVIYNVAVEVCSLAKLQSRRQKQKDEYSSAGLVLPAVVGSLLGLAALCVLIIVLVKRNKKRQRKVFHSCDVEKHVDGSSKLQNASKCTKTARRDNNSRKDRGRVPMEMHACMNKSIKRDFITTGIDRSVVQITGIHQKKVASVSPFIKQVTPCSLNDNRETTASIPSGVKKMAEVNSQPIMLQEKIII